MTIEYPVQRALNEAIETRAQIQNKLAEERVKEIPCYDDIDECYYRIKDITEFIAELEKVKARGFGLVTLTLEEISENLEV